MMVSFYVLWGEGGGGVESHRIEPSQKKARRLITNSNYPAHITPLFIELGLL